jgi:site-specific DNA recombinase
MVNCTVTARLPYRKDRNMVKASRRTDKSQSDTARTIAAYIRVSTEDQAESGLGMDSQRTRCKAMAQVKGWPEPTFYVDDGISGTKPVSKRPGLKQLVEDIMDDKIQAVIVLSLDRLGRTARIIINLVEDLRIHNVALVSCKESFDTSTPQGQLMLGIFAVLAQFERDLISQRTTDALTERGKRDGDKGGRLPYGYKRTEKGIIVIKEEAKMVRRIFKLHKQKQSLRDIAKAVSTDKQWQHSSIAEILRNEDAYKGSKRGESDVRWPAIL